jgi:hypothetical protein
MVGLWSIGAMLMDAGGRYTKYNTLTLFGCYAMTWLFDEFQNYMRSEGDGSHPLPYLRLHGLMQTATNNLPAHIEDFAKLEEEVCGEFDFIRHSLPGFYGSESVLKDRARADIKGQLEGLAGHFDTMLPALAGLEFSKRSPDAGI